MQELINDNSIIGLDLGTSKICASLCTFDENGQIHIAGVGTSITEGINKGSITNTDLLIKAIKRAITRAERIAKISSKSVIIGLASPTYKTKQASGVISLPDSRDHITTEDKISVIKKARQLTDIKDYSVIHTVPQKFFIDDKLCNSDPIGTFGSSLKADILTIQYRNNDIELIKAIFDKLNLSILAIVASPLATSKIALTTSELNTSVALIDIGGGTTQLAYYQNNIIRHLTILPIGGDHISSDIKIILKTSTGEADRLKILYCHLNKEHYDENNTIEYIMKDNDKELKTNTSEDYLSQIIKARLEEIFKLISQELKKAIGNKAPEIIVITGGTSNLPGIDDYATNFFKIPVRIGIPKDKKEVIESQNYATSIGLVVYAIKSKLIDINKYKIPSRKKVSNFVKKWFKDFF
ncbi:MAG: cell division protein FtsA [Candidatus Margulisiibacteriota bacterium]|nr:MAG: cell division protein FtsA [Candidatus Margulisbacteria bacterium GWD2_39_127]OGI02967.1 MAG: cell division protein FtsA [Candidatus Margulisbacteria bacterium GWF2_38_17]OGI09440.1 MAG: cell division protein FtsA [Candidatus Margulisbacteria bacterium GWE2_39_32]PZM78760.1 MAG: cell division protein FtsA [Candidatus Margulisiibacteriota bacterium]HAR63338.1 cell division protein FtsA [Candidatus Margulisiibacteriota bacterium]